MPSLGMIAVVGAGAVGLYYGGRLAAAGHDVHFFTRSDAATLRAAGLVADSAAGDFVVPADRMHAYDDVNAMPRADLVISTLKATARPHYRELIGPLLKPDGAALALQNGLGNEEALAELLGADRVLGGIAYVCIHRTAPGRINHTAQGELKIGEFGRPVSERLRAIAEVMKQAGIEAIPVDDLRFHRWHKLVWNIPFNGLGAILDLDCAQLLTSTAGEALVRQVMNEVIRAAAAVGIRFDDRLIDFQIARTRELAGYRTSMQLDRRAGRAMEIDAILGEPIRQSAAEGEHDLPTLRSMLAMLETLEGAR